MNKAENRFWNTIQLANCEGRKLKIIGKNKAITLGHVMEYNHDLDAKYYNFTLTNGDCVMLEELSVHIADYDQDILNIYIDDEYEVGCYANDVLADDVNFQYYSIERVYENIPDID